MVYLYDLHMELSPFKRTYRASSHYKSKDKSPHLMIPTFIWIIVHIHILKCK